MVAVQAGFGSPQFTSRWRRWQIRLMLGLSLAAGLWLVIGLFSPAQFQGIYSRGPLAAVHQSFEQDCRACHAPFEPLTGSAFAAVAGNEPHAGDARCTTCHPGPAHSPKQRTEQVPHCAGCHREHRGSGVDLKRLADSECTHCHRDLKSHVRAGEPAAFADVLSFDNELHNHPDFRSLTKGDPGKLKFNHKIHLELGTVDQAASVHWTLGQIEEKELRERYRRDQPEHLRSDGDAVRLRCSSCHMSAGLPSDGGGKLIPGAPVADARREAGAYMAPINYEQHCQACHPLTLVPREGKNEALVRVPHGLQPEQTRDFLWGALARNFVAGRPELRTASEQRRPLPGRPLSAVEREARAAIEQSLRGADAFLQLERVKDQEKLLYRGKTTCGECHHYNRGPGNKSEAPDRIVPPNVPVRWFRHALFSHKAHEAVECTTCHSRTGQSVSASDMLIPGKDTCVRCHGSGSRGETGLLFRARSDCTECHDYHPRGDRLGQLQPRNARVEPKAGPPARLPTGQALASPGHRLSAR